jgi:hypothetical protein
MILSQIQRNVSKNVSAFWFEWKGKAAADKFRWKQLTAQTMSVNHFVYVYIRTDSSPNMR